MKKKEIQQKYKLSERLFWKLIALGYIKRVSYRDYEIDEAYFVTFDVVKFWEDYKQRPEVKERQSLANKKRSDTMKKVCLNEEYRKQMSEKAKIANARPEVKEKISQSVKQALAKPEVKQKLSNSVKQALAKPEIKEKHLAGIHNFCHTEEYRKKISSIMKKAYDEKPELKSKIGASVSKTLLERWKDETWRRNRIAKMHSNHYSKALSEGIKKHYLDEEKRQKTLAKTYATKKANGTFNSSSWEDKIAELSILVFGDDNVIRHYSKDARYPFECDIYVKSLDLFIEFNFHWTHQPGYGFYDEHNKEHNEHLTWLKEKAKTSKAYENSITVWTKRDITKRDYAFKNQLNWVAFWTFEDAYNWIEDFTNDKTTID